MNRLANRVQEKDEISERAEYPHQALIGFKTPESIEWIAGGSIISSRFILTASHVTQLGRGGKPSSIAVGVKNMSDTISYNGLPWQIVKVKFIAKHPSYKLFPRIHDIALIKTETQIEFNENVLPACLDVTGVDITDAVATTWDDITQRKTVSDTIQTVTNIAPFSKEKCYDDMNTTVEVCLVSNSSLSHMSWGYSGEPLLINSLYSSCPYIIVGVTSIPLEANPLRSKYEMTAVVFTKISMFVPWIEKIVWAGDKNTKNSGNRHFKVTFIYLLMLIYIYNLQWWN
ncbi:serine protease snake-like [Trichoplusia ni]|uniref:Serine protease snake-like n=1 Tax=Trichoplusia ni TaxID=7111 RepID=A0A7E5WUS1_TRINI|nr:serine protease snake-like [Trichoplusia ni]